MHNEMSPRRALSVLTMVCVAAIALTACSGSEDSTTAPTPTPTATVTVTASPSPGMKGAGTIAVAPELGYVEDLYGKATVGETGTTKNKVVCPDMMAIEASLSSTVSVHGALIRGSRKDGVTTIRFAPGNDSYFGGVVNGKTPFRVPGFDVEDGSGVVYDGQPITIAERDFGGPIKSVVLCGYGGM